MTDAEIAQMAEDLVEDDMTIEEHNIKLARTIIAECVEALHDYYAADGGPVYEGAAFWLEEEMRK